MLDALYFLTSHGVPLTKAIHITKSYICIATFGKSANLALSFLGVKHEPTINDYMNSEKLLKPLQHIVVNICEGFQSKNTCELVGEALTGMANPESLTSRQSPCGIYIRQL
jgi:hypothetical protein